MQEKYRCLYRLGEAQRERVIEDQVLIVTRCQQILIDRLWLPDRPIDSWRYQWGPEHGVDSQQGLNACSCDQCGKQAGFWAIIIQLFLHAPLPTSVYSQTL